MDPLSEGSVELRNTLGEDQQSESNVPNAWHDDNKKGMEAVSMKSYLKLSGVNAEGGPCQGKTRGVQAMWATLGSIVMVVIGPLQERASP